MPELPLPRSAKKWTTIYSIGLSLLFSVMLWNYVDSRRVEERLYQVPLEIRLPRGWEMTGEAPPDRIAVSVIGSRAVIDSIRLDDLLIQLRLELPPGAGGVQESHLPLRSEDIRGLPQEVRVTRLERTSVSVRTLRPVRNYVPVHVETTGMPAAGYQVTSIEVSPDHVAVFLPEDQMLPDLAVRTPALDLGNRRMTFREFLKPQPLQLREGTRPVHADILVTVHIEEISERRTFENVPVSLLLATPLPVVSSTQLIPARVNITVTGRQEQLKTLAPESLTVYIDTRDMGGSVQGEYVMKCRAIAPRGIQIEGIVPDTVRWIIPPPTLPVPEPIAPPPVTPPAPGADRPVPVVPSTPPAEEAAPAPQPTAPEGTQIPTAPLERLVPRTPVIPVPEHIPFPPERPAGTGGQE